jgi:NAD(P)-dependent dehydrogenase (short-subunit alcohol dehydrogenase family)
VERAARELGRLDILVNNAAWNIGIPFPDLDALTTEIWDRIFETNVRGPFQLARAAAPHMRKQGAGRIVNIASIAGVKPTGSSIAYASSKAALIHLTRCQAADLAADNIRANSLSPAWTWSRPLREAAGEDRELAERFAADLHILRRFAEPREVAEAVVFLCSEHASFITGCDLACDGGNSALGPEGLRTPLAELREASGVDSR